MRTHESACYVCTSFPSWHPADPLTRSAVLGAPLLGYHIAMERGVLDKEVDVGQFTLRLLLKKYKERSNRCS